MAKRTKKNSKSARSFLKLEALEQRQLLAGGFTDAQGQQWSDLVHPNGNVYDQVLMKSSSITVNADAGQITRVSFLDQQGDIVQAEFGGAGTLTISLDGFQAGVDPTHYLQTGVKYVQGTATFTIQGSDATTNLTVWSVGSGTAVTPGLFDDTHTGGNHTADVARVTIVADPANPNGSIMGGIRAGNAVFSASSGVVGITAANVQVQDVVRIGDIDAKSAATPALVFGANSQFGSVEIAGGDLVQSNGKAINNSGSYNFQISSIDNFDSAGTALPAQTVTQTTFTDKDPFAGSGGKTFNLTAGVDTVTGSASNDTFVGNSTDGNTLYLTSLDKLTGGDGTDSLTISYTGGALDTTGVAGLTISGIEQVSLQATNTITANTSGWTGVTTLTSVSTGGATLTAAGTTDVTATESALAGGTATVTGGEDVTLTALGVTTGGEVKVDGAKGVVTTSSTGVYADGANITLSGTTVKGGTDVSITERTGITSAQVNAAKSDATNFTLTLGAVSMTGTTDTKTVTVTQDAKVGEVDDDGSGKGKIGVTNGAVTIADVNAGEGSKAGTITAVTLNSYGNSTIDSSALTTVTLSGTGGTLGISRGALTATPTENTLTLNVKGGDFGAITDSEAASDDGFKTLNIVGSGAKSTIADLDFGDATALNISGDKEVVLSANSAIASVTAITVTNTAGASLGGQLGNEVVFTGGDGADSVKVGATKVAITAGAGNDTVTIVGTALGTGGSIDAGDGTDTLSMSSADAAGASSDAEAGFESKISGFERLSLGTTGAANEVKLNNLDDINYVTTAGVDGGQTLTLSGANTGMTLVANNGVAGTVEVSLANATSNDVLNVNVSEKSAKTINALDASGFETINFNTDNANSNPGDIRHVVSGLTDAAVTTITVTGDAGLDLTANGATKLASFDASAVTKGGVSFTTGALTVASTLTGSAAADTISAASATKAVTINGGGGADTITGSATIASTLNGGDGNDTITGGAAADTIDGGAGTDTFVADLTEQAGASTTDGAVINLSANALTQSGVNAATGKFLAASAPSVASGTATYVFSGESSTNAVVVDTLVNVENATGTSGVDYIVGSAGNNVITGGAGKDVATGGDGSDTFVFAAGANGAAPSDTVFDTITDFASGSDKIDFGATAITQGTDTTAAAAAGHAAVASGVVTFDAADDTLAERIIAVNDALDDINNDAGATDAVAGESLVFGHGGDTYIFISDGVAGIGANDVLIKLSGLAPGASRDSLVIAGGDITGLA